MTTFRINTPSDAVREITRLAVQVIADGGHTGHSAAQVQARMNRSDVQDAIRNSFARRIALGQDVREAFTATGQALIAHYCNSAGIPTRDEA
jgi:hypothetical protein